MIYSLNITPELIFDLLRILLAVSLFFVWVVRYDNIVKEFKDDYNLPDWLRDLVGIIKLSCAGMILTNNVQLQIVSLASIAFLMFAAVLVHIKIKNPVQKMIPAIVLLAFCLSMLFLV
tara:strand:- start:5507 stop:5860 length:354 start_codon:yes stop_codon:yes gene_type:complete